MLIVLSVVLLVVLSVVLSVVLLVVLSVVLWPFSVYGLRFCYSNNFASQMNQPAGQRFVATIETRGDRAFRASHNCGNLFIRKSLDVLQQNGQPELRLQLIDRCP